jgi:uncharacterized protein (DUF362 family)
MDFSRRNFFYLTGAGALAGVAMQRRLQGQQEFPPPVATSPIYPYDARSPVALVKGEDRRKNVTQALLAVDREIGPALKRKKYVVIKINNVSTTNQLAATHVDALRGILDYLEPKFKGPVVIVESSAADTLEGFENYKYAQLIPEYKRLHISLVDLNRERKYQIFSIVDANIRPIPVRLAARMFDPDAYIISSAMLKTHNAVVATMSIKNMVIGTPLHSVAKETPVWSDKQRYHASLPRPQGAPGRGDQSARGAGGRGRGGPGGNFHAMNYSMAISAKKLSANWGAALIDGFEGMEGNGPAGGTPVPMHVALASSDYLAADRVALEIMGVPPHAVGYLQYAGELGVGQYDLEKIDIRGEKPETVKRVFKMHDQVQQQLDWLRDLQRPS